MLEREGQLPRPPSPVLAHVLQVTKRVRVYAHTWTAFPEMECDPISASMLGG